jgi:hypothetical protein
MSLSCKWNLKYQIAYLPIAIKRNTMLRVVFTGKENPDNFSSSAAVPNAIDILIWG